MALIALLVLTLFLLGLLYVYTAMALSSFWGIPFVPSDNRKLKSVFAMLPFQPEGQIIDLGCGNGSVLFYFEKHFPTPGVGIEINPLLHWWNVAHARLVRSKIQFKRESMYSTNISSATIIYCFLFPEALVKLKQKFLSECKPGTTIISHGFRIKGFQKYEWLILDDSPFKTYYYTLPTAF